MALDQHLHAMLHDLGWWFTLQLHHISGSALWLATGTQVAPNAQGLATIVDGQLTGLGTHLFGANSHFINFIVQIRIISRRAEFNMRAATFGGQENVCSCRSYRMNSYFQGLLKYT